MRRTVRAAMIWALIGATAASPAFAQGPRTPAGKGAVAVAPDPYLNDVPAKFTPPPADADYVKRVEMIPMRDGVKLYTVIWEPKGAKGLPIILTRTPYNAAKHMRAENSPSLLQSLSLSDEPFVKSGYIRVYQDVRGKYGSEGDYAMTRPPIGPLNSSTVDHTTDAYDTIDWLVKHLPQSNGRVGMIGSSYEGFTVVTALLKPHPALKAAVPESPMIDGWMGDDWFHYGAFRQTNFDYIQSQTAQRGAGAGAGRRKGDDYEEFLSAGSGGDYARSRGLTQMAFTNKVMDHPAYDQFWRLQALDKLIVEHPTNIPTMWEQGLWDQEDMWGAIHSWEALKAAGHEGNNWLVMGPWFHSQVNREGFNLGVFKWDGDTALQFRRDMVTPFFDHYLKDGPDPKLARVSIYNTGENHWDRLPDWPAACAKDCKAGLTPIYMTPGMGLSFTKPAEAGADAYVSDPAKPVPYLPRPVKFSDGDKWRTWLVQDQRFIEGRPDVLTYVTPPLTAPVALRGAPQVDLSLTTTGTDGDFVVRLIDVWPDTWGAQPELAGYEQPIGTDIFRGRYRDSFSAPTAIPANTPFKIRFGLPQANHVFQPGHRIMVTIASSAFPLYDRNPQTFVPNIFNAKPGDYQKATITVLRGGAQASAIWLPVVK